MVVPLSKRSKRRFVLICWVVGIISRVGEDHKFYRVQNEI